MEASSLLDGWCKNPAVALFALRGSVPSSRARAQLSSGQAWRVPFEQASFAASRISTPANTALPAHGRQEN
jgi:hypothetical protein